MNRSDIQSCKRITPSSFKKTKELLISFLTWLYSCNPSINIMSNFELLFLKKLSLVVLIVPPEIGSTPTLFLILILENRTSFSHPISK